MPHAAVGSLDPSCCSCCWKNCVIVRVDVSILNDLLVHGTADVNLLLYCRCIIGYKCYMRSYKRCIYGGICCYFFKGQFFNLHSFKTGARFKASLVSSNNIYLNIIKPQGLTNLKVEKWYVSSQQKYIIMPISHKTIIWKKQSFKNPWPQLSYFLITNNW